MAVPKRRHSSTRGKKRRTNWKLKTAMACLCGNCGQRRLPHRVCANCGYYGKEEIIGPQTA